MEKRTGSENIEPMPDSLEVNQAIEEDEQQELEGEIATQESVLGDIRESEASDEPSEEEMADIAKNPNWNPYWRERLKSLNLRFPEEIQLLVDDFLAFKSLSPEQQKLIWEAISEYQEDLKIKYNLSSDDTSAIKKEENVKERKRLAELKSYTPEKNKNPYGQGEADVKEQEDSDKSQLKNIDFKEWRDKLAQDFDLIPANIKDVVGELIKGETLTQKQQNIIADYIRQRIKANKNKEKIIEIQSRRKKIMAQLKDRLRSIDAHEDYGKEEKGDRRVLRYDQLSETLFVKDDPEHKPISIGDIAADADWGVKYAPDDTVPYELWRKIRKISDIREARHEVEKLFDQELKQIGAVSTVGAASVDMAYLEKHPIAGYIAERMVRSLLTRVQYNNPSVGFRVENSNAVEDLELKYDFKLLFSKYTRGVAVEPAESNRAEYMDEKRKLGIQFTIGSGAGKNASIQVGKKRLTETKYKMLVRHPVNDVVLLKTDFNASMLFNKWRQRTNKSGGPEQYLSREQKVEIFEKALEGKAKLSKKELDELVI